MVKSTPMMVMTTSSSISVKPAALRLPVMIGDSVQALALRQGVHVENIIAGLRIGGRTLGAAQTPGIGGRGRGGGGGKERRGAPPKNKTSLFFFCSRPSPRSHPPSIP